MVQSNSRGLPALSSPLLAALMYQDSSGGFRAITNPTGTTIWMAAGSDFLKQRGDGSKYRQMHRPPLLFRTVLQGQHLVVIVCLMSPWLAPCCSSTRGCQTLQPSAPYPPLEWPRFTPGISMWTDSCSFKIQPTSYIRYFESVKHPKPPQESCYSPQLLTGGSPSPHGQQVTSDPMAANVYVWDHGCLCGPLTLSL